MSRRTVDMSPGAVDARIREALRLGQEARRKHRESVDMSPEAVDRRLRRVSELRRLCLDLMRAGRRAGLHDREA